MWCTIYEDGCGVGVYKIHEIAYGALEGMIVIVLESVMTIRSVVELK